MTFSFHRHSLIAIFALSAMVSFFSISACAERASSHVPAAVGKMAALPPNITISEAARMREQGAFVLDVREVREWEQFHIPGSTLIPLGELAGRVAEVPRDRDVVVVCRTGNRSKKGRDILLEAGFTRVTNMEGGVTQWKEAGYPTVSGK